MSSLIDRQAAIDEIEYEIEMINSALDSITLDFNTRERLRQRKGEAREILNSIQQLPSAQPERKTGRWEEKNVTDEKCIEEWQSARCSACDKYHTTPYIYYFDNYNFCPNCGAKMEVEHEAD